MEYNDREIFSMRRQVHNTPIRFRDTMDQFLFFYSNYFKKRLIQAETKEEKTSIKEEFFSNYKDIDPNLYKAICNRWSIISKEILL